MEAGVTVDFTGEENQINYESLFNLLQFAAQVFYLLPRVNCPKVSFHLKGIQKDAVVKKYGIKKHSMTQYVSTEEEMRLSQYFLEDSTRSSNFVHSDCRAAVTDNSPLYGLDCEMVYCWADGKILQPKQTSWVSLMDCSSRMILHQLVNPSFPIKNYATM